MSSETVRRAVKVQPTSSKLLFLSDTFLVALFGINSIMEMAQARLRKVFKYSGEESSGEEPEAMDEEGGYLRYLTTSGVQS